MNTLYTTRDEAIAREILEPLEPLAAYEEEYNIEAIADEVLEYVDGWNGTEYRLDHQGFRLREGVDFWAIVAKYTE